MAQEDEGSPVAHSRKTHNHRSRGDSHWIGADSPPSAHHRLPYECESVSVRLLTRSFFGEEVRMSVTVLYRFPGFGKVAVFGNRGRSISGERREPFRSLGKCRHK